MNFPVNPVDLSLDSLDARPTGRIKGEDMTIGVKLRLPSQIHVKQAEKLGKDAAMLGFFLNAWPPLSHGL